MRARTSGGMACSAFCISSAFSGRFMDSGMVTGTPGLACASLIIGKIVGEAVAAWLCCGACWAAAFGDAADMLFGLAAGCTAVWPPADFDEESETTLLPLQADKLTANVSSAKT